MIRVTVFMKSGNSFAFKCDVFTVTHKAGSVIGYKYEGADPRFRPIMIDPLEIEAVLQEDL